MAAPNYLPNWQQIGPQFVEYYYNTFDTNREGVVALYHPTALLTFEETQAQGHEQIREALTKKVTFGNIQHAITKVDCQPTPDRGIIILVTGRLKTDEDHPHGFSQTFYVKAEAQSFFIIHDIFRLSLHNV